MSTSYMYAAFALVSGLGIPVMAAINSTLGGRLGSPVMAAVVLFVVALTVSVAVLVSTEGVPSLKGFGGIAPVYFTGGLFVAFYVLVMTWVAPKLGVGNAIMLVLLGQMISAAIVDHFGLFGAPKIFITPTRLLGLLLMLIGIYLARKPA